MAKDAQLVTFIVSIVLARILAPEDYGTIALITVFTTILQVFVDSGLGTALIQKKNADDMDFSSVFYFNFIVCIILYICMFFSAPFISKFYNDNSLTPVIRVISLTIVISGVKGIQQAYVSKYMMFKRFFFSTIGGTIFSAILGIILAYEGCGVWALVAQQLSNTAMGMIILLSTMWFGVKAMAYSSLLTSVLSQIINSWPNRKLLNYGYLEQVRDFAPGIILAVFMGLCVYIIGYIPLNDGATLIIQIIVGAAIYIGMSAVLKLEEFEYLSGMIKSFRK